MVTMVTKGERTSALDSFLRPSRWVLDPSRRAYVVPALSAGLFGTCTSVGDNWIEKNILRYQEGSERVSFLSLSINPDSFIVPLAYLVVGYWLSVIVPLMACTPLSTGLGRWLDPDFRGLTSSWKIQMWAIPTGFISTIDTFFYLLGHKLFDPSIVLPLSSASVAYRGVYDLTKKDIAIKRRVLLLAVLAAVVGIPLISVKQKSADASTSDITGAIILEALLIVALFQQGASILRDALKQEGVQRTNADAFSFEFWRKVWGALFATLGTGLLVVLIDRLRPVWVLAISASMAVAIPWIVLRHVPGTAATTWETRAQKLAPGLTEVSVLTSLKPVVGVLLTLAISFPCFWLRGVWPFGEPATDVAVWVTRSIGAVLLVGAAATVTFARKASELEKKQKAQSGA
jgi:hypothetical protein